MIEPMVQNSKCVLLPGGRDYHHCVSVFEDTFQIKVPSFPGRALSASANGRQFVKVKSRDIPGLIQQGFADIGIAYTDVCEEKIVGEAAVAYEKIGSAQLKLSLLSPYEQKEEFESRLYANANPIIVATAYPRLLAKHLKTVADNGATLNIALSSFVPSGSVEAMVALGVADAVVDVVNTGITAEANKLNILPLADIFPAVIYRK